MLAERVAAEGGQLDLVSEIFIFHKNIRILNLSDSRTGRGKSQPMARNKFLAVDSPHSPTPLVQWAHASAELGEQFSPNDQPDPIEGLTSGYQFPEPAMLIFHSREELIPEYFCTWLRLREVLLARVGIPGLDKPIGSKSWKTLFGNQLSVKSGHMNTFQQQAAEILAVISAQFNGESLDPEALRNAPMKWGDEDITANTVLVKGREIVWELTELNFRADFQAIDDFMHVDPMITQQNCFQLWRGWRELRLCTINRSCWPDTAVDVDFNHIDISLTSTSFWTRFQTLYAFYRSMKTWLEHSRFLTLPWPTEWVYSDPVTPEMEKTVDDIEYEIAKFYLVAFKCVFGRAAVIPHKL
jgi:hypothetical protein